MARQKNDGKGRMGGRRKGTPNKVGKPLREMMQAFAEENFEDVRKAWNDIDDPKMKCLLYLKLCKFVLPTLSSVDMTAQVEQKSFADELKELSEEDAE